MIQKFYSTLCSSCGADCTKFDAVYIHISVAGKEFDLGSELSANGLLADRDGLVEHGYHTGTYCSSCRELLEVMRMDHGCNSEKFVTTPEVEGLLFALRAVSGNTVVKAGFEKAHSRVAEICNQAADTITLLSREKTVTNPEVEKLLDRLSSWKDNHTSDSVREMCQQAIDTITLLSRVKVVTGTIEGGVLDLDPTPDGVEVDIRDYDCEGMDEDNLDEDETGSHFKAG